MAVFSGNYRCASTDRGCTSQNHRHDAVPLDDLLAEKTKKLKQWQETTRQEVLAHNLFIHVKRAHPLNGQRQPEENKRGRYLQKQAEDTTGPCQGQPL